MSPDILSQARLPPTDSEWDEAFLRVESYMRAHQIESRMLLNRLVVEIVNAAYARVSNGVSPGSVDPVSLAMQEAERRMHAWFTRVLGDAVDEDDERMGTRGRIALVLADVPARWPQHFLAEETPPPDLVEAMRTAYIEAGPELELSRMVPRPMDFGPIANVADEAWKTFRRLPLLRAIVGWMLFIGLLAFIWFKTH